MHYVITDIHGCYHEYLQALKQIQFHDSDTLYVLGDCIDRGTAPIKVLQDMMHRSNVIPLVGNHEYMALNVLKHLCVEISDETIDSQLTPDIMLKYMDWISNGAQTTIQEFRRLSRDEQQDILDYLGDFRLYEEVCVNGKEYLLVHAGLEPFENGKDIEDYSIADLLFSRANYDVTYFPDKYTITGHTPTVTEAGNQGTVIRRNNHIALDCGCVYGYNLAVYCMETEEIFYIPYSKQKMKENERC